MPQLGAHDELFGEEDVQLEPQLQLQLYELA